MAKPGVLTLGHRDVLENLWGQGHTVTRIAEILGVSTGTVCREVDRNNSAKHGTKNPLLAALEPGDRRRPRYRVGYRAAWAQRHAAVRMRRSRPAVLACEGWLRWTVLAKLARRWSPQQIRGWLQETFPECPEMHVSHETIYQAIYVQSRGGLRAELKRATADAGGQEALRSNRSRRRPQAREARGRRTNRGWVQGLNVSTRPAEADDRAVPGHWEGDLVIGGGGASAIVTLVERTTRYVLLGSLPQGRDAAAVAQVLGGLAQRMPAHLRRSLTWDQGAELALHAGFTVAAGCPVFFCDPHSPWQRGSNENTNGLLRQYFPKGVFDFHTIDQAGLDGVAHELNTRPRQTLGWATPARRLAGFLQAG